MHAPFTAIRAEIAGSDTCVSSGITVRSPSPVLAICRALIDAGHDPATPLEAWRGHVLCLRVRSISEAARLEVNAHGTDFIRHRGRRAAAPMRQNGGPATGTPPRLFSHRREHRTRRRRVGVAS